ncbi:MAG: carbamoyltransferase [Bryobacteraceae bacterium]
MRVLGISAFYHDSAAALVRDGEIIAAAQEERFSRKKHDARFPAHAIDYCLAQEGVRLDQVDYVVFYDKPFLKFERLLETYIAFAPRGLRSFQMAVPLWLKEKLFQKRLLREELQPWADGRIDWDGRLLFAEHHLSHAASAFFPSPFEEAAVLTMDGVGEWATTSLASGRGNHLEITKEIHFPHSLGLLYSAFTYYTGFKVNSGEYKVMGLAPYGEPRYASLIFDNLLDVKPDGSFRLNLDYFDYCTGLRMTNRRFDALFGGPARKPDQPLTQRHMDVAASVQAALEEVVLRMTRALARESGARNLCLAGGVALNCVANGRILRDGHFREIWIQPAAGDAGGALGAALAAYYLYTGHARRPSAGDDMQGSYLGPFFSQLEIEQRLAAAGARFTVLDDAAVLSACVDALVEEKAVGWFQGRMEFGPRALGARSILGDPRSPRMQSQLNLKVKFRESFRPFAPAVLAEDASAWFELDTASPYMLLVADVVAGRRKPMTEEQRKLVGIARLNVARSEIPAVTHVDDSARIQTVHEETNPRFHALLRAFKQRTGCAVLVNTSFNVRGEPIVCTPEDAFACFMGTGMEMLVAGNCVLRKEEQPAAARPEYKTSFAPD